MEWKFPGTLHDISSKQIVDYLGESVDENVTAGVSLMVTIPIAYLKVVTVNQKIKIPIVQVSHDRSIHEFKAFGTGKKWTIHIKVPKFLLVAIGKLSAMYRVFWKCLNSY